MEGNMSAAKPFFTPITITLLNYPAHTNTECMTLDAFPWDTVQKLHDLCHERLGISINWMLCPQSLPLMKEKLVEWREKYGDEAGICECGIFGEEYIKDDKLQNWVPECGIKRPAKGLRPWHDLTEEEAFKAISRLKDIYSSALGFAPTFIYAANGGDAMIRALKRLGIGVAWGYNWNLYGDGVDATGRGAPPDPFFISSKNIKAPAEPGDTGVIGVPWGTADLSNTWNLPKQSRIGINNVCLNPHELANRSGAVPDDEYVENVLTRFADERSWNPYSYVPLQCEAVWLDESGAFYAHHPLFNTRTTERFLHEILTAYRLGATFPGFSKFREWFCGKFNHTPVMMHYCKDLLPGVEFRGKDHTFEDTLVYCSGNEQFVFDKANGFNPVYFCDYTNVPEGLPAPQEFPARWTPQVELKVQEWIGPAFGINITPEGCSWKATNLYSNGFPLTSAEDIPNYKFVLWKTNLPEYIKAEDIVTSDNVKDIRLIPEYNTAVVSLDLRKGNNLVELSSDLPAQYITMEPARRTGKRYEIYITNTGAPAGASYISAKLDKNLQIGGFWWNGKYYDSLFVGEYSVYDWRTGDLHLKISYPGKLTIQTGINRLVFEVIGTFDPANPCA